MGHLSFSSVNNIRYLLRLRWWLAITVGLTFTLLESSEYWLEPGVMDQDYLSEILRFGIIFPLLLGLLLSGIDRAAVKSLDKAVQTERQRIAREIHDSVGQNLSYLHLKLEYLATNDALDPEMAQELERVRAVADEAYRQVRGTLSQLNSDDASDVVASLFEQARSLGHRSDFSVDFVTEGQSAPLPLNTQLAIIYIFREALINIGKHAQAHKVRMRVIWTHEALSLELTDDGRGFVPETVATDSHFGIKVMHERAQEIDAHLTLTSHLGAGTQVKLWVPLRNV